MNNQNRISYVDNEKRSNKRLALFTSIWLITTALLAFGPTFVWEFMTVPTIVATVLNLGAGGLMVWANIKHLKSLDELGQKIFLNSAAITLGVVLVFGVCYELLLTSTQLFTFAPSISHVYFVMGITFMASTYAGHRKYR